MGLPLPLRVRQIGTDDCSTQDRRFLHCFLVKVHINEKLPNDCIHTLCNMDLKEFMLIYFVH